MKRSVLTLVMLTAFILVYGQNERKVIRDGIRAYGDGEFEEAEVQFRKAESINQESYEAEFNTGAALYKQQKFEETVNQFESLLQETGEDEKLAQIWHNIGNSLLESRQYAPSIEAYKNSLRKNPADQDTRYNLAYAMEKLKEQEKNQDQQQQEQEKNRDQQEQDQQQQEQEKNRDQQEQDQEKNQDQQEQDQEKNRDQPQTQPREISEEDAERLLNAIQQQEKEVKEKVDEKKAAAAKVKTEKDW
ncbi:MAG: hypothetical protein P1P86_04365 [Bacteroidales bacterium]|nr:hypothetical protein [Bacteroidales bacterium]